MIPFRTTGSDVEKFKQQHQRPAQGHQVGDHAQARTTPCQQFANVVNRSRHFVHFVGARTGWKGHLEAFELPWNHVSPKEGRREEGKE